MISRQQARTQAVDLTTAAIPTSGKDKENCQGVNDTKRWLPFGGATLVNKAGKEMLFVNIGADQYYARVEGPGQHMLYKIPDNS